MPILPPEDQSAHTGYPVWNQNTINDLLAELGRGWSWTGGHVFQNSAGVLYDVVYNNASGNWDLKKQGDENPPPPRTHGNPNSPGGGGGVGGGGATIFGLSQGERDSLAHAYWQIGQQYGWNINGGMIQTLLNNAVSPAEVQQRLEDLRWVKDNKDAYDQFEKAARRAGILKQNQSFGTVDRLKLFLGQAPEDWYRFVREGTARTYAAQAGFTFGNPDKTGGDTILKGKDITSYLNANFPGLTDLSQIKQVLFNAAQLAHQVLSGSRLEDLGITRQELLAYAGGTASEGATRKIHQILANQQAFQNMNQPQALQQTQGGTTVAGLSRTTGNL